MWRVNPSGSIASGAQVRADPTCSGLRASSPLVLLGGSLVKSDSLISPEPQIPEDSQSGRCKGLSRPLLWPFLCLDPRDSGGWGLIVAFTHLYQKCKTLECADAHCTAW